MTQTSQAYLNLVAQRATIKAQQTAVDANRRVAQASKQAMIWGALDGGYTTGRASISRCQTRFD